MHAPETSFHLVKCLMFFKQNLMVMEVGCEMVKWKNIFTYTFTGRSRNKLTNFLTNTLKKIGQKSSPL